MIYSLKTAVKECEELLDDNAIDDWDNLMFQSIVWCFNIIAEMVKHDKTLPFFDLKKNWKLLRKHKYDYALINVQEWMNKMEE